MLIREVRDARGVCRFSKVFLAFDALQFSQPGTLKITVVAAEICNSQVRRNWHKTDMAGVSWDYRY